MGDLVKNRFNITDIYNSSIDVRAIPKAPFINQCENIQIGTCGVNQIPQNFQCSSLMPNSKSQILGFINNTQYSNMENCADYCQNAQQLCNINGSEINCCEPSTLIGYDNCVKSSINNCGTCCVQPSVIDDQIFKNSDEWNFLRNASSCMKG
ncbi:hypothetical protein GJ496_007492 [Pomphorhynchus laevis]|nr:hypothetical protein GJ496_007492 [Pomphorhynchus laevis]